MLRTWGLAESSLAELVAGRSGLDQLDEPDDRVPRQRHRGHQGAHHREVGRRRVGRALLEAEEAELRALLGDLVFGVDDETME